MSSEFKVSPPVTQNLSFLDLPSEIQEEIVVIGLQNGQFTVLDIALVSKEMAKVTRSAITRLLGKLERFLPKGILQKQIAFLPFNVPNLNDKQMLAFPRFASLKAKISDLGTKIGASLLEPKDFSVDSYLKFHQCIEDFKQSPFIRDWYSSQPSFEIPFFLPLFWKWNGMIAQYEPDKNLMLLWYNELGEKVSKEASKQFNNDKLFTMVNSGVVSEMHARLTDEQFRQKAEELEADPDLNLAGQKILALMRSKLTGEPSRQIDQMETVPGLNAPAQEIREFLKSDSKLLDRITTLSIPAIVFDSVTAVPEEVSGLEALKYLIILIDSACNFKIKALPEKLNQLTNLQNMNIPTDMAIPPETYKRLQKLSYGVFGSIPYAMELYDEENPPLCPIQ